MGGSTMDPVRRCQASPPCRARHRESALGALLLTAVLAGCAPGGASTPSPGPSGPPSPPVAADIVFRATVVQALPPIEQFEWLPLAVVTADGRLLTPGPMMARYPGPLVAPIEERTITPAGVELLLGALRDAGLLTGQSDFTGGTLRPGQAAGRLEVVADGRRYEIIGDPSRVVRCGDEPARCIPAPGTPEAFAHFWLRLADLPGWLASELGPPRPYAPTAYAVLVGPPPEEGGLVQQPATWPIEPALAEFGRPLSGDPTRRCGLVTGAAATTLRPVLEAANELTSWVEAADPATRYGLTVRPLLPGDPDPCLALVGP
ncbi:MAG TPA: hypothetical protein VNO86_04130 [Candidatus Binatia bacterium]|nr:hypothetical protein [Candidatus Binatia bacterium]